MRFRTQLCPCAVPSRAHVCGVSACSPVFRRVVEQAIQRVQESRPKVSELSPAAAISDIERKEVRRACRVSVMALLGGGVGPCAAVIPARCVKKHSVQSFNFRFCLAQLPCVYCNLCCCVLVSPVALFPCRTVDRSSKCTYCLWRALSLARGCVVPMAWLTRSLLLAGCARMTGSHLYASVLASCLLACSLSLLFGCVQAPEPMTGKCRCAVM
jgi:hypothetical protein